MSWESRLIKNYFEWSALFCCCDLLHLTFRNQAGFFSLQRRRQAPANPNIPRPQGFGGHREEGREEAEVEEEAETADGGQVR